MDRASFVPLFACGLTWVSVCTAISRTVYLSAPRFSDSRYTDAYGDILFWQKSFYDTLSGNGEAVKIFVDSAGWNFFTNQGIPSDRLPQTSVEDIFIGYGGLAVAARSELIQPTSYFDVIARGRDISMSSFNRTALLYEGTLYRNQEDGGTVEAAKERILKGLDANGIYTVIPFEHDNRLTLDALATFLPTGNDTNGILISNTTEQGEGDFFNRMKGSLEGLVPNLTLAVAPLNMSLPRRAGAPRSICGAYTAVLETDANVYVPQYGEDANDALGLQAVESLVGTFKKVVGVDSSAVCRLGGSPSSMAVVLPGVGEPNAEGLEIGTVTGVASAAHREGGVAASLLLSVGLWIFAVWAISSGTSNNCKFQKRRIM
uniref:Uncharacterized protein n=1 Tax=Chromera velia CCMP2878 TaxID=1169474 RepID=A0A0G4HLH3_9ALVE|eukprot:Cvel_28722.t1-p1 / transcript=Cvel_28722.t1 / gene=Cvel_28722 / organism=Chromera_velia_CCMP2878 / gene_product=hypothetical protein / transcript_product=hypothetical protein / location=Cvel_scaffold3812:3502-7664(+) / protein_length=373 / sequence_SO=supercontig / SO=protein_coding / is_pseudo=false